jgi:uncharacterized OB-fold protein
MTYPGPLADVGDPLTAPFWRAVEEHRLVAQRCLSCRALRWLPAPICPECWAPGGDWEDLSGTGVIYSFATYRRAMAPAFKDLVPYTVALVTLDEGIEMHGMLERPGSVAIGDRVQVTFLDVAAPGASSGRTTLLRWQPLGVGRS